MWLKAGRLQIDGIEILPFYFCHIDMKINIKSSSLKPKLT